MTKLRFALAAICACSTLALSACSDGIVRPNKNNTTPPKTETLVQSATLKAPVVKIEKPIAQEIEPTSKPNLKKVVGKKCAGHHTKHEGDSHKAKHYEHTHALTYKIKSGDTLSKIASQNTLTLMQAIACLRAANKIDKDDLIVAGETLRLPSAKVCREKYLNKSVKAK
tara:strand:+ start:540 stop:1046 length:507 start_codon:yes stop_codon:yes gene_type:complete